MDPLNLLPRPVVQQIEPRVEVGALVVNAHFYEVRKVWKAMRPQRKAQQVARVVLERHAQRLQAPGEGGQELAEIGRNVLRV